jgi:hypothetical protein
MGEHNFGKEAKVSLSSKVAERQPLLLWAQTPNTLQYLAADYLQVVPARRATTLCAF